MSRFAGRLFCTGFRQAEGRLFSVTNSFTLLKSVRDSMRGIAALVSLLGDDRERIAAYEQQFPAAASWMLAVREMKSASLLVLYRGTGNGRMGARSARVHRFSILIRSGKDASIADLWQALIDGVPSGGVVKWWDSIHEDVVMVQEPELEMRTMAISETAFLDYWEATFELVEKFSG